VIQAPFIDLPCVIELIVEVQPDVVVVEQTLAAQRAGTALMDRLHNERYTRAMEIRPTFNLQARDRWELEIGSWQLTWSP